MNNNWYIHSSIFKNSKEQLHGVAEGKAVRPDFPRKSDRKIPVNRKILIVISLEQNGEFH